MIEREATAGGVDPSFFDAEIERGLDPYRNLVSEDELGFMRERLRAAIVDGPLRDLARRAAPRIIEESVEAPLTAEAAEALRREGGAPAAAKSNKRTA